MIHRTADMAVLWVPGPLPGLNELLAAAKGSGGRGMAYARLKREWTDTIWALAKAARLPSFDRQVQIQFEWAERDKRRDPDNVAAGGRKLILDGLAAAGVIQGDGWAHVLGWMDRFGVAAACPGVTVKIETAMGARPTSAARDRS